MKALSRLNILIVIGVCITTALPILAAIALARQQAVENQEQEASDFARSAVLWAENTGRQLNAAALPINRLASQEACSPAGLDLMRQLDLNSTLLQAVGWVEEGTILCSSFGGLQQYELGQPDVVSIKGRQIWNNVQLIERNRPYVAVQIGSFIGIVHKDLALSFVENAPGLSVGVFSWSGREMLISRGNLTPDVLDMDFTGETVFYRDGMLVSIVKSEHHDTGGIAVLPVGNLSTHAGDTARILIPLGVLVGLALSALLIRVVRTRSSLPMMLKAGLRRSEFRLHYQPVINLASGDIVGVEALLRWNRAEALDIPPDRFIAVAEQTGLISQVTARVLDLMAEDVPHIRDVAPCLRYSVNFAAEDLYRENSIEEVNGFLEKAGLSPHDLVIEATERSVVDAGRASRTMDRFRAAGVKIAIDDFGTGYSSLAYLTKMPVDILKIDKLFVKALGTDAATSQVASRIIEIGQDLGLLIVAEGIETPQQEQLLRNMGVNLAQGHLFGAAMPLDELVELLRSELPSRSSEAQVRAA